MSKKPTVLMILDGYGLNDNPEGNAIKTAKTPVMDLLYERYPHSKGYASGLDVGLPKGQMGNSEVGHLNIGAGRIVYQELTRITKAIDEGDFFENPELSAAMDNCKKNNSALHIMGLLSDGGVHSHNSHLYAIVKMAKKYGFRKGILVRIRRRAQKHRSWKNSHCIRQILCYGQGQTLGQNSKSIQRNSGRKGQQSIRCCKLC